MDDDKKNGKPGGRPRAAGAGRGDARKGGGGFAGKPAGDKKPFAKKAFGKKPFGKPGEDRPRSADAGAAGERSSKPYGTGPRKPYAGKPAGDGPRRPYSGRPAADGASKPYEKKPFAKKPYEKREVASGERPEFRRDDPRDAEGGERSSKPYGTGLRKPYAGKPAGDGPRKPYSGRPASDGPRKPYEKKPYAGKPYEKREAADGDRPARSEAEGRPAFEKKPYEKKPYEKKSYEKKPYAGRAQGENSGDRPRPGRFERAEQRPDGAARPASADRPFRAGPRPERKPFERRDGDAASRKPAGDRRPPRAEGAPAEPGERIAKRLARAGIASRRDAEELIAAGRVRVNGKVLTSPAVNVAIDDRIELDGTEIPAIERTRLFLFHKPGGVVTTNRDPEGRRTVFDVLPEGLPRLMTIGRLDINTEGLLLLTNDGGLARVLELPATGWLRRYRVRVHGKVDEKALGELKNGIAVDGVFYGGIEASIDREQGTNAWLTIGLREGKNREVKNVLGALGLDVTRLIRISYGPFQLGELAEGTVQELKGKLLRDQLGERLIEESGANFEAPVTKPFTNKPVRAEPIRDEAPRPPRESRAATIGEGGLIKARKRREGVRDDALGRLSTRPDAGSFGKGPRGPKSDKGFKSDRGPKTGRGDRESKPIEPPGGRKANVWMAPGARPMGTGRAEAEAAEREARKAEFRKAGRPAGKPSFSKSGPGKSRGDRPDRPAGEGPRGPRKGGPGADRRR